jgi:hypothetical protein
MAMGRRMTERQADFWVPTTNLPQSPGHPFYEQLDHGLPPPNETPAPAICRRRSGGKKYRRLLIAALATLSVQDLLAMLRWFCVLARLLVEVGAARRDTRSQVLKAQVEILRRRLAATGSS